MTSKPERDAEFYSRYQKPVIEPYIVGYSGIDPPLKPQAITGDTEHEDLGHLLGGNELGHYHLTGKEHKELRRLLGLAATKDREEARDE